MSYDAKLDGETWGLLTKWGVDQKVGKAMAVQWRGYPESVRQAIVNTAYRFEADAETLGRYRLSRAMGSRVAYLVGSLNGALAEGHRIRPSRLAKADKVRTKSGAREAVTGGPADSEFEQRKQEQIRKLKGAPAKPVTPYTEAELAVIKSKRDKPAQDAKLREAQAAARCRYHGGYKYANMSHELRISVNPCS
ncbi:unnamed protein product [marine sediment metagenome]|uniref:Uncharacterized protein n=1 Tax=marine sediment metagenome TaxID=412755 RepID=X1ST55_9ZZZZ